MKNRGAIVAAAAALGVGLFFFARSAVASRNVAAFLALIRMAESGDRYDVIAGGDTFADYSEHPFIIDPNRRRPLGTTASGAYQMVRKTWTLARDGAGLTDFSPDAQDAAAVWLLKHKVPGFDRVMPEGTGNYELVAAGRFDEAIGALGLEWEAFAKMMAGRYHVSLASAREFIEARGGVYAA